MSASERAHVLPRAPRRKGWRIAARLRVIILAPLVAVLGFAGLALAGTIGQAQQAARLGGLVTLATDAGDLAYNLQIERAVAVDLLTSNRQPQLDEDISPTGLLRGEIPTIADRPLAHHVGPTKKARRPSAA